MSKVRWGPTNLLPFLTASLSHLRLKDGVLRPPPTLKVLLVDSGTQQVMPPSQLSSSALSCPRSIEEDEGQKP